MIAQIFYMSEDYLNENLFLNSGWQNNMNGWTSDMCCSRKYIFDGCKALRSIRDLYEPNSQVVLVGYDPTIPNVGAGAMAFSLYIYSPKMGISSVTSQLKVTFKYKGEWGQEKYLNCKMKDLGDHIFRASYIFKNLDSQRFDELRMYIFANVSVPSGKADDSSYSIYAFKSKLEYGDKVTGYRPALADGIPYQDENSFQSAKVGDISKVQSYNYKKSMTSVGTFSMSIPKDTLFADKIREDAFILYDNDWLIINNVKLENGLYNIEGTDGKGLLAKRVTLGVKRDWASDVMTFDTVQGSTEYCLKHYILNNIVNPIDIKRKIPFFAVAKNKNRGLKKDSYLSRLEPLNEVATKLCQYSNIGYDVYADLINNKMVFDIVDVIDKTANQRDRNQVIFSIDRGNVASLVREKGNSNFKNVFYANKTGDTAEADITVIKTTRGGVEPAGIGRNEMQVNVSCDKVDDIVPCAKKEMSNYRETDSLNITASNPYEYGLIYKIGDKVTVIDKSLNLISNKTIRGVDKTISSGQKSIALEFGEGKPKPLNKLNQKINQKGV